MLFLGIILSWIQHSKQEFQLPVIMFYIDGLLEVNLGDILSFFTGANRIPPLGFADATLNFNPFNLYPTASTCGLCLTLPTKYDKYDAFKEAFVFSILNHGGFGLY